MNNQELSPDQIEKMVALLKAEIDRVGAANIPDFLRKVKDYHSEPDDTGVQKVEATICLSGEYFCPLLSNNTVRKNPNYSLSKSVKETNNVQRAVLMITVGVSVVSLIISFLTYKKTNDTKVYLIPSQIQKEQKDTQLLSKQAHNKQPTYIQKDTSAKR